MQNRAISILDKLITMKAGQGRLLDVMADFKTRPDDSYGGHYAESLYMCIPEAFRPALDIQQSERVIKGQKKLVWTQGSRFNFKLGDTLYDSHHAYKAWPEGLKDTNLCIQVKEASPASPPEKKKTQDGKTQEIPRDPGRVEFIIKTPDENRETMVEREKKTLTQDEFVRFLIIGLSLLEGETNG